MREGHWISYQPWVHRWDVGFVLGRTSGVHLVREEGERAYRFACGKSVEYDTVADEWLEHDPKEREQKKFLATPLRRYCRKCLRTVGMDRPRDRTRDHQRKKVYRAEWAVERTISSFRAKDHGEAQDYVDMLMADAWMEETFPGANTRRVNVRERKGHQGRGHANAKEIALTGGRALEEYVILHELAHTIHDRMQSHVTKKDLDHSGHGAVYVGILLALVDRFLGEAQGDLLRQAFRGRKVKWTTWTTELLNEEA